MANGSKLKAYLQQHVSPRYVEVPSDGESVSLDEESDFDDAEIDTETPTVTTNSWQELRCKRFVNLFISREHALLIA